MSFRTKNPRHPSALSINDLTVGRHVLLFNVNAGVTIDGIVVSLPHVMTGPMTRYWATPPVVVDIRSTIDGLVRSNLLTSLGVVPLEVWGWSQSNFVVDHRKRHLLPEPVGYPSDFLDSLEAALMEQPAYAGFVADEE